MRYIHFHSNNYLKTSDISDTSSRANLSYPEYTVRDCELKSSFASEFQIKKFIMD